MTKTAREIRNIKGWTGDARLYELSVPLEGFIKVVVSATNTVFGSPETSIFGCNSECGENLDVDFGELPGSIRGALDHEGTLASAGYVMQCDTDDADGP
jgi:hypothetical protein